MAVPCSPAQQGACGGVGQDLMRLVSRASTIKIQEERKLRLTDSAEIPLAPVTPSSSLDALDRS